MGSPLGAAKYNSLLQGAASLDRLGTTALDSARYRVRLVWQGQNRKSPLADCELSKQHSSRTSKHFSRLNQIDLFALHALWIVRQTKLQKQ